MDSPQATDQMTSPQAAFAMLKNLKTGNHRETASAVALTIAVLLCFPAWAGGELNKAAAPPPPSARLKLVLPRVLGKVSSTIGRKIENWKAEKQIVGEFNELLQGHRHPALEGFFKKEKDLLRVGSRRVAKWSSLAGTIVAFSSLSFPVSACVGLAGCDVFRHHSRQLNMEMREARVGAIQREVGRIAKEAAAKGTLPPQDVEYLKQLALLEQKLSSRSISNTTSPVR